MTKKSPRESGFFQPAEWASHDSVWLAYPSHEELWEEELPAVQREFVKLCQAIQERPQSGSAERIELLVRNAKVSAMAKEALRGLDVNFHEIEFGDIWLRDTAPIFLNDKEGKKAQVCFTFNGWGSKYSLPFDDQVSRSIAKTSDRVVFETDFVLEGGAVDVDGEGTVLTTRQCLLNPNRNPGMEMSEIEDAVLESLGAVKLLWLGDGLLNDHTDGHVDTVARFVAPGVVVCMEPSGSDDPNAHALRAMIDELKTFRDAKGRKLEIVTIPSPGLVADEDNEPMPASYVNFYIANGSVVVPTYGSTFDDAALKALEPLFPNRKVIGSSARHILNGGGAFHCITQQVPR